MTDTWDVVLEFAVTLALGLAPLPRAAAQTPEVFPQPSPSPIPLMECKNVSKNSCFGAKYPNLIQCGDYRGYVNLNTLSNWRYVKPKDTSSIFISQDVVIYSEAQCSSGPHGRPLKACYYDTTPHGVEHDFRGQYKPLETELVELFRIDTGNPQCANAGIPVANTPQTFCAGLVTCRGMPTNLRVCRAKADLTCPSAEDCERETVFSYQEDDHADLKDTVDGFDPLAFGPLRGLMPVSISPASTDGAKPQIVSDRFGNSQCFEVVKGSGPTGSFYFPASAVATPSGGCPALKRVVSSNCFLPFAKGASGGIDHCIRVAGKIRNIDSSSVQVETNEGKLITISKDVFSERLRFHPGEIIDLVVKAFHVEKIDRPIADPKTH